eukprot:TRINITY_DN367_c1_g1_i5.p2 TRINITY_DN367_c1_g1~~TRINITY_DN367_c1_g1_i5.p2  ORF type:complete len:204 (+),score=63.07 TRINITY_DN367_c1_g1_i5:51-614(+)
MSWYWQSDLRTGGDASWTSYAKKESKKIEDAFKKKAKTVEVSGGKYIVDFKNMIQYRKDDDQLQRPVKRVEDDSESDSEERIKGPKTKRHKPMVIKAKTFARSGTFNNNAAITEVIESLGGFTSPTVTKTVDYLICPADEEPEGVKVTSAKKYRIPIMFLPADFRKTKTSKDDFKEAMKPENMQFEE